ncbi:hypothetical protein [Paenibacillus sp. UNC451MF]|nr:hypothetical protein [Paenibacillus sp. UNC451MF]
MSNQLSENLEYKNNKVGPVTVVIVGAGHRSLITPHAPSSILNK